LITIVVGSKNPVKVNAVQIAANSYWKNFELVSINAPSNISNMPLSKEETRIGAKNRALAALDWMKNQKDNLPVNKDDQNLVLAVGNEGGITSIDGIWYLFGTTLVTDGKIESWGGETLVRLPSIMVDELQGGQVELGEVIDKITGETNTKQKGGAIAILTNNVILREELFSFHTKMALSPWVHNF